MENLELTKDAIVSIDAMRTNAKDYKAGLCDAFSNTVFLVDMVGSLKEGADNETKECAWQVIKTLADYANVITAIADK